MLHATSAPDNDSPAVDGGEKPPWTNLKCAGNGSFRSGDFSTAIFFFSQAIDDATATASTTEMAMLFHNRALARLKLAAGLAAGGNPIEERKLLNEGLVDARRAVGLAPGYAKVHFREAQLCAQLGLDAEALSALHATWRLVPGDVETHHM